MLPGGPLCRTHRVIDSLRRWVLQTQQSWGSDAMWYKLAHASAWQKGSEAEALLLRERRGVGSKKDTFRLRRHFRHTLYQEPAFLWCRCLARPSVWSPLLPPWRWGGLYITWSIFTLLPPAEHYDGSKHEPQCGPTCLLPTPEEFMCCLHPLWWDWCRCHLWCKWR